MGALGLSGKKRINRRKKGDIAEKKKKKRRRKSGENLSSSAVAAPSETPSGGDLLSEAGPGQKKVGSSHDFMFNCTPSDNFTKRKHKKKRLKGLDTECSTALQSGELPADPESSSEKEKKSLLAWVEMCLKRESGVIGTQALQENFCNGHDSRSDHEIRLFNGHAFRVDHEDSSLSHMFEHEKSSTSGNDLMVHCEKRSINGDAIRGDHGNRSGDRHVNYEKRSSFGHVSRVDHEVRSCDGHVVCNEMLSNGHAFGDNLDKCLSNGLAFEVQNVESVLNGFASPPNGHTFRTNLEKSFSNGHAYRVQNGESLFNGHAFRLDHEESLSDVQAARVDKAQTFHNGHAFKIDNGGSLQNEGDSLAVANSTNPQNKKRKREDDKVLQYIIKRCVVKPSSLFKFSSCKARTARTVVIAWGKNIPVTVTSEASTVQEWISAQNGDLFGLDVEWRPNRYRGEQNKVALLQLCGENECLIIQMLFLDRKPPALSELLMDPLKGLAGVGVLADGKRLLHDHGLECQGGIELTKLAVERLQRDELRHVGLKVLVQEVLGLKMDKPKKVTLSNWAKLKLDPAQVEYACMDAWASFALSQKLLGEA